MNPPLISIVLATYNGERFLRAQMDSLVAQTYPAIEIVAVDDVSSDNTFAILEEYAAKHAHLRIFRNEKNLGYVANFEKALRLATGEFICFCDQDDVWDVRKTELLFTRRGQETLSYCNSLLVDAEDRSLGRSMADIVKLETYHDCLPFLIGNCVSGHALLVSRQLALSLLPFPRALPHDWWLAFHAAAMDGVRFVDETLVRYRQHGGNSIGVIRNKSRKRASVASQRPWIREKMRLFAEASRKNGFAGHEVLTAIERTYRSFSLPNNFRRMMLFLRYRDRITALKHRSAFRRWTFCLKMFWKII
jgi:glycosyltransferase involved in cell wall biosynthesis